MLQGRNPGVIKGILAHVIPRYNCYNLVKKQYARNLAEFRGLGFRATKPWLGFRVEGSGFRVITRWCLIASGSHRSR